MPSSIMFCPSAIHIQPRVDEKVGRERWARGTSAPHVCALRARAQGVVDSRRNHSAPRSTSTSIRVSDASGAVDPSRMLLWVPSNAIAADWNLPMFSKARDAQGSGRQSVTEMSVKISAVRPIS